MSKVPTIKFDTERLTQTVLADLERNIRELPEVSDENFEAFYDLSVRAVATGGDLNFLCNGITELGIAGMTGQRAAQISTFLWRKAQGMMDRERKAEIGITRGVWTYSNAPCMANPGRPTPVDIRRDASHKAANGRVYVIAEGLLIDGKRTWPGDERYCRCASMSIIPGLEHTRR